MRYASLLLMMVWSAAAQAAGPHPSLPPPTVPECFGVNIHFTEPKPGELEMLAATGVKWVRTELLWSDTERVKGEYDFSVYDRLTAGLDQHKLHIAFTLAYGNPLYAEPGGKHPFTSRAATEEFRAAYARWAAAAVAHFQKRGYLWELWSQPNSADSWKPKPNASQYFTLAFEAASAIHAAAPGEAVIGPATMTIDLSFLEECFREGLLDQLDAVSLRPRPQGDQTAVDEDLRNVRLLIRKYAPKDKAVPIIATGFGIPWRWVTPQILDNLANDVVLTFWNEWRDRNGDIHDPEGRGGMVEYEWTKDEKQPFKPKSAYRAFKVLSKELGGYHFNKRLLVHQQNWKEAPSVRLYLFSRGPDEQKLTLAWSPMEGIDNPVLSFDDPYVYVPASHGLFRVSAPDVEYGGRGRVAAGDDGILIDAQGWGAKILTPEHPNDFLKVAAASPRLPLDYVFHWPEASDAGLVANFYLDGVRNPLSRPIILPGGTSSPDVTIKPGEENVYHSSARGRRTRLRETTQQVIRMENGQDLYLMQEISYVCLNPIELEPLPPTPESLFFRILNPTGEAATLHLKDEQAEAVTAKLSAGEVEKVVKVPRSTDGARRRKVSVNLDADFQLPGQPVQNENFFYREFGEWWAIPGFDDRTLTADCGGDPSVQGEASLRETADHPPTYAVPALSFQYSLERGWKFAEILGLQAPILPSAFEGGWFAGWPKKVGIWIHGDGKGMVPKVRFVDAARTTFQSNGPKIDWTGWRFVTFSMTQTDEHPLEHWGGVRDDAIHYPIHWDAILLLDNESREPVKGEILVAEPTLIY